MKKPKKNKEKHGCLGAIFEVLGEVLGELIIAIIAVAAGLPLYFLLPKKMTQNLDFDDLILLGIPLLFAIALLVFLILHLVKKRKAKRQALDEQRYYKAFHCMYGSIFALYDDLKDTVSDIEMKDGIITVRYHTLSMTVEKVLDGYRTRINGSKNMTVQPDETIYQYIMEFLHDQRKENGILEISDDRITAIKPHGIVYTDIFDREFVIDFADCANEYAKEGSSPFGCIGECDAKQLAYIFYTPRIKTKVVFDSALITGKKLYPLRGSRKKRFSELKKRISDQKYTVYMKNFD